MYKLFEFDLTKAKNRKRAIMLLAAGNGQEGFTEDDLKAWWDWIADTITAASLLENCLEGKMVPSWKDGELSFAITKTGEKRVESLVAAGGR